MFIKVFPAITHESQELRIYEICRVMISGLHRVDLEKLMVILLFQVIYSYFKEILSWLTCCGRRTILRGTVSMAAAPMTPGRGGSSGGVLAGGRSRNSVRASNLSCAAVES